MLACCSSSSPSSLISETTIILFFPPGVKNAVTSRLKNVNSSDDNVKQASKLSRFFREEKRSWQVLTGIWKRNISDDHHSN